MANLNVQRAAADIETTSSVETLDDNYLQLAAKLSAIHGTVRVARENSGIHFYMASPYCLENYGTDELHKLHLAVNIEKYFTEGVTYVGMCMKSGETYDLLDLLSMPPLSDRGYEHQSQVILKKEQDLQHLEHDEHGNLVPKSPGQVRSILELPESHPALRYLRSRNFDPAVLSKQMDVCYCEAERDDTFYRRLPGGFRVTPQGRLIFYIRQNGIYRGWQGRVLELSHDGIIYYWHPYKKDWVPVLQENPDGKPIPLPGYEGWDMAKYYIAPGTARNECLMGYDSAIEFCESSPVRYCVLAEGALDIGRVGPPGMGLLGKHMSDVQADLLMQGRFSRILYVRDRDEAGAKAEQSVRRQMEKLNMNDRLIVTEPPGFYKDLGEVPTHEEACDFVRYTLGI